jgi:hypothetical protein
MRTQGRRRTAALRIEALEDRRVLSLLGLGSLQQNLLTPLISQLVSPAASVVNTGTVLPSTLGSVAQAADTTVASLAPVSSATAPVGQPLAGSAVGNGSSTVGALVRDLGVQDGNTLRALVTSPGATALPPAAQHANGVAAGTGASDGSAGVLTAAPTFLASNNYLTGPTVEQAASSTVNGFQTKLNTQPALVERGFVETSPGRDQFGAILREDQQGNILFAAAVNDELPVDSLMYRQEPQEADLLTSALPADTPSLELGVQQFLSQLNDVGRELSRAMTQHGWLPWVLSAGLTGMAALEFVRRQEQRRRLLRGRTNQGDALSWVPGLPGTLGF